MHPKEFKKVKNNTGYFTHNSLKNSELFVGIDFSNHTRINAIIESYESYILFPSQNALNLSTTNPKRSHKPIAIFLIDSTWACAKKVFTQSQNLQQLPHMSFTTTKKSEYQIKEQPQDNYLSTIESTYEVLKLLESHSIENYNTQDIDSFLAPFYTMIRYQKDLIASPKSNAVRFKCYK
jgi:DTW domain-containing protein YfiP